MAEKKPKKLTVDELASQYGYAATFFFSDGELKRLIEAAVKEQWSPAKFQAKFQATKWYRTRGADARQWSELKARDPAEAAERRRTRWGQVRQLASQMGIALSTDKVSRIVDNSLLLGWDDKLLREAVGAEFKYAANGGTQGESATMEAFIRKTADDFGVPVSDSQVGQWVGGTMAGTHTQDGVVDFVRDMARSKYPGLNGYLDKGFTVRQVAEPYVQSYAQILEMPADTVNMTDVRIQRALQGVAPDKQGAMPQAQTLYDFERDLRKDPRWRRTKNAKEQMTSTALGVLQDMGIYS